MNIPKRVIGWFFFLTGFMGGIFLGYLQLLSGIYPFLEAIMGIYSVIYIMFLASWFMLFDYVKRLEKK